MNVKSSKRLIWGQFPSGYAACSQHRCINRDRYLLSPYVKIPYGKAGEALIRIQADCGVSRSVAYNLGDEKQLITPQKSRKSPKYLATMASQQILSTTERNYTIHSN